MNGLDFSKAPSSLPSKRMGDKSSRVRRSDPKCCSVKAIIGTMLEEQKEHHFSKFGEAYSRDRKVVTSWMMDVCEYFSLHPTTIHGAIAYLDRLQPSDKHSRYEWKMFVVCCILISDHSSFVSPTYYISNVAKYNESELDVPDLETLEYLIQLPIPKDTLLNYELWTLQKLGWKLNARTALAFIACYVVVGVAFPTDVCWDASHNSLLTCSELDHRIGEECYAMASFAMLEAQLKPYRASDVACAILYFVRRALGVAPVWSAELTSITRTCPTSDGVAAVLRAFDGLLLSRRPSTSPTPSVDRPRSARKANSDMTTPVSARSSREIHEVDALAALVSNSSISAEGEGSPQWHGHLTPEDKENKYSKGQTQIHPSPVSVIAMDSLEHGVEA